MKKIVYGLEHISYGGCYTLTTSQDLQKHELTSNAKRGTYDCAF